MLLLYHRRNLLWLSSFAFEQCGCSGLMGNKGMIPLAGFILVARMFLESGTLRLVAIPRPCTLVRTRDAILRTFGPLFIAVRGLIQIVDGKLVAFFLG